MFQGIGAVAAITALLTIAAARSSGRRRLGWSVAATAAGLLTGWSLAIGTAVTQVVRFAEEGRRPASS